MRQKQVIYISSFPKSGSTYLTRLLGDILNCPTGGCIPKEDATDIVTEGQDRPGPYLIRRGHYVLSNQKSRGVTPAAHKLAWKQLTNERIIILIRDPRGVCVSGADHWQVSVNEFLDQMIAGKVAGCGRWDNYYFRWLDFLTASYPDKGRFILYRTINCQGIKRTLDCLELEYDQSRIPEAFKRQCFQARAAQLGNDKDEMRRNNMRKGIIDDWKDHFTVRMNEQIKAEFGWMMGRIGYE